MTLLSVALGGAIGASLRFLSVGWATRVFGVAFPFGTLGVNVIGSLVMGILAALFMAKVVDARVAPFLMTGVLGGFTTFSAFSLDALTLFEQGKLCLAMAYICLSVLLSIGALTMGLLMTRSILT